MQTNRKPIGLANALGSLLLAGLCLAAMPVAQAAEPVKLLLDWAWLPYHSPFVIARDKGYYKEAGLDVDVEQGRGSATTAMLLAQKNFDIAHLNVTNAAQLQGRGAAIKVVGIYQHQSGASFVGIKGKVKLDGPKSLIGLKIGSTPGGSDQLSLTIFTRENHIPMDKLNVISLNAQAKTAALFSGQIDVVSGDAPAYDAYVRATNQQPETLLLTKAGVPLVGFGFAVNEDYLKAHPDTVRKFLAATKRGFADAVQDPKAACEFMGKAVHLAGNVDRCVDYFTGLMALSDSPTSPSWGHQSKAEWDKLIGTLRSVKEFESTTKTADLYTNDYLPQ